MFAITPGNEGNGQTMQFSFIGHNAPGHNVISTKYVDKNVFLDRSRKGLVEVNMFFELHNYYDINVIFFVFCRPLKKGVRHSHLSPTLKIRALHLPRTSASVLFGSAPYKKILHPPPPPRQLNVITPDNTNVMIS